MPVIVETDITPSKRRYALLGIPLVGGALILFSLNAHFAVLAVWLCLAVPLVAILRSELQPSHLRFEGDRMKLWLGNDVSEWTWLGEGRLSYAFLEFQLVATNEERLRLRIWRDSISETSWRALKMAYRVNRVSVLSELNTP